MIFDPHAHLELWKLESAERDRRLARGLPASEGSRVSGIVVLLSAGLVLTAIGLAVLAAVDAIGAAGTAVGQRGIRLTVPILVATLLAALTLGGAAGVLGWEALRLIRRENHTGARGLRERDGRQASSGNRPHSERFAGRRRTRDTSHTAPGPRTVRSLKHLEVDK